VLGCGGGKSCIEGMIARSATEKKNQVLFLVHRKELCDQIRDTFTACEVNFEYCDIYMVQTACRRISKIKKPAMIITDESHHALATSYRHIYSAFPDAILVGFTATPARMNEGGLGAVFDDLIESVSTEWLIENHYLAPYKYYGVTLADTSRLHTKNGDFDKEEVAELMDKSAIFGNTVENWKTRAEGKQTIVYCANIKTSVATADEFKKAGIAAYHLDGTTPKKEREQAVEDFRQGKIKVLCNVDLFGEGFDVPDCECVVLLRPTKSLTLHIQQSMRPMRYKPNKVAVILDHVGNYTRHGLPDDKREWSLAAKKKKDKNCVMVKQCPKCFMVMKSGTMTCPYCGYEFPVDERKERELIDGILLEEISKAPYQNYKKCRSWEELEAFRKGKKYKFGWSLHKAFELNIQIPQRYRWSAYKMGLV
jgi:superfamily II DNA or RNA helicase